MSKIGYVGLFLIGWAIPDFDKTFMVMGVICVLISLEIAKLDRQIRNCGPWY